MYPQTQAVEIRELEDNLSAYLREVRLGTRLLLLDRGEVVGEIAPLAATRRAAIHPLLAQWARAGQLTLADGSRHRCPAPSGRAPAGSAQRLLGWDRGT